MLRDHPGMKVIPAAIRAAMAEASGAPISKETALHVSYGS